MSEKPSLAAERARTASREEIPSLLQAVDPQVLTTLVENERFEESHLLVLLERKDLSPDLLDRVARRRSWLRSYAIRRALAFHPHTPRLTAMRLARELYLMDLLHLSLGPAVATELRRIAEELILARLPQLPLGEKIVLARRASARVAGGLLAEGHREIIAGALDNAFLTEAQVLKVLAREKLPAPVVTAIAGHRKWSHSYNVRLALLRRLETPLDSVLGFLPDLNEPDLEELARSSALSPRFRGYVRAEIARRAAAAKRPRRSS